MKRKYLLITLALCGMLAFGGCKIEDTPDVRGTIVSESIDTENEAKESADTESTDTNATDLENSEEDTTKADTTTVESTEPEESEIETEVESSDPDEPETDETETDEPETETAEESADAKIDNQKNADAKKDNSKNEDSLVGEAEGNIYENAYFNVGCKLPDSYEFLTKEQIDKNNQNTKALTKSKAVADALDSGSTLVDMQAANYQTNSNMIFVLSKTQAITKGMSEEEYFAAVNPALLDQMSKLGMTDLTTECVTVTFAGSEHTANFISGSLNGTTLYQYQLVLIEDAYTANVSVSSVGSKDDAEKLLGTFYSLNK